MDFVEENVKQGRGRILRAYILTMLILGLFIVFFTLITREASGTTYVNGHISEDTTWNTSGDPYIVTQNLYVDHDVNLTIEPGVEVRLLQSVYFHVDGNLFAVGNESEPISFTSDSDDPTGYNWGYINVRYNGHAYLDHCNFSYCSAGIRFDTSSNNSVSNSTITHAARGIIIDSSTHMTIANVHFWTTTETVDIGTASIPIKENYNHTISGCTLNGRPLLYYFDREEIMIKEQDVGDIILAWCRDITIDGCTIIDDNGISLLHTTGSTITNCNISRNEYGILIYDYYGTGGINGSMMNSISNNTFFDNSKAIYLSYSDGNIIRDNQFISNGDGIFSYYSSDNGIFHNNFIANNEHIDQYSSYSYPNYFHEDNKGNYWDDYEGDDIGGDSIGDESHYLGNGVRDFFPLMAPWTGNLPPDTTPPFFLEDPNISEDTQVIPEEFVLISFEVSEGGRYEIIIDTDGTSGFDNSSDTVLIGNVIQGGNDRMWNGLTEQGEFVEDGEYGIQLMIWDRAGNPVNEPFDLGSLDVWRDMDGDRVFDVDDAFPDDPHEWSDLDGDGIGDNSDTDLDGDGVDNGRDEFPEDPDEWRDMDHDDIGDNADPDDNGNDIPDIAEIPLVFFILVIPLLVFYYINRYVKGKKEVRKKDEEEKKETKQ
jgi:parallel beta-helix repeat protein